MSERLDKWLSDRSADSRKEIKALIRGRQVRVNDAVVTDPGYHVAPDDTVSVHGVVVTAEQFVYIMLHKPQGVVSVSRAPGDRTVIDLLPPDMQRPDLFPAGRLDRDTTGFVLITNDGEFAHRILSPKKHVDKVYRVLLRDPAQASYLQAFADGIVLGDGTKCLSASLSFSDDPRCVTVRLREGRYHQVKRMFASLGNQVVQLHRESIGAVSLDPALAPGECRPLTKEEIQKMLDSSDR